MSAASLRMSCRATLMNGYMTWIKCQPQAKVCRPQLTKCTGGHDHSWNNARRMSTFVDTEVRKMLSSSPGGSVDLDKNEESGIAVVTLNNPQKQNAVTGKMMIDLADVIAELETWKDGRGLIFQGKGGTFCAGADVSSVLKYIQPVEGGKVSLFMQNTLNRMLNLPLISVALAEGHCLGGGAELLTGCDFRVASKDVKIGFLHVKLCLMTGWGAATRLTKLVGRTSALQLLASGKVIDAETALDLHLVDHILPPDGNNLEATKGWMQQFTENNGQSLRLTKDAVVVAADASMTDALRHENNLLPHVWGSEAHVAALKQIK